MKEMLLVLTLLGGCELEAPKPSDCIEFFHNTSRDGVPVQCKMVWCEAVTTAGKTSGGVAALWCTDLAHAR